MSPESGVRRAPCPCGEPNPPEHGPCTPAGPCQYAISHPDLWDHYEAGPFHPQEPTPLDVARVLLDPFNWMRLGLAVQWGTLRWVARRLG